MKKIILSILTVVVLTLGIKVTTAHACGFFVPCSNTDTSQYDVTQKIEAVATEANQQKLLKDVPIPQISYSQERRNLVRRLETFNKPDKISYIYLINYGKVMAFYTVKGKVSSVNSLLTTPEQVVDRKGNQCGYNSTDCFVVQSPDLDGSYGSNGDAIFFFTTEGAYVEWHGDYMLADQPLNLATQPELVREVK